MGGPSPKVKSLSSKTKSVKSIKPIEAFLKKSRGDVEATRLHGRQTEANGGDDGLAN